MRAVVYDAFCRPATVREVPEPDLPPHGALIRVRVTGMCRSDWHGWMGHDPDIRAFPHVPGHELAGTVEAVGARVRTRRPGERVTVPFVCGCGTCGPCAKGDHQVCDHQTQPGFTHWGSWAELVAIDHADVNLVPLPDAVDDLAACTLGCRYATAFRALLQVGRLAAGEWVAVHGCGGVGLAAVQIAAAAGARVVALDVDGPTLPLAKVCGAELAVAAGTPVRELTQGGVHLSLDAVGHPEALADSIAGLRKRGRHVQIGLLPDPPLVPMHLVIARELELLGAHGMAAHAYPELLGLVASGRLKPQELVTRELPLEAAGPALAVMDREPPRGITVLHPRSQELHP